MPQFDFNMGKTRRVSRKSSQGVIGAPQRQARRLGRQLHGMKEAQNKLLIGQHNQNEPRKAIDYAVQDECLHVAKLFRKSDHHPSPLVVVADAVVLHLSLLTVLKRIGG